VHFDPDIVTAFLEIEDHFHAIAMSYVDSDVDLQKKVEYREMAKPKLGAARPDPS